MLNLFKSGFVQELNWQVKWAYQQGLETRQSELQWREFWLVRLSNPRQSRIVAAGAHSAGARNTASKSH